MFRKLIIVLAMVSILTLPVVVLADNYGLQAAAPSDLTNLKLGNSVPQIVGSIIGIGLSLIGIIFFLLILYAGFLWMTALGNSQKADKAKEIMEAAGIGLVIILAAYAITNFVFKSVTTGTAPSGQNAGTNAGTNLTSGACCVAGVCQVLTSLDTSCSGTSYPDVTTCQASCGGGGTAGAGQAKQCSGTTESGGNYSCVTEGSCTEANFTGAQIRSDLGACDTGMVCCYTPPRCTDAPPAGTYHCVAKGECAAEQVKTDASCGGDDQCCYSPIKPDCASLGADYGCEATGDCVGIYSGTVSLVGTCYNVAKECCHYNK